MAKGRRGRPAMSPDEKDRRREERQASKYQALAMNPLAKMPVEKDRRLELFREGEAIKADAQAAAGQMSQHKKRLADVFGITKAAQRIREILVKCHDGEYEATVQQVKVLLDDIDRPFQLSMFTGQPGQGVADDEGSIFDKTASGERHDSERRDDPARARRGKTRGAEKAATPSPGMPLDEAEKAFEAANKKAAGKKAPPAASEDEEDVRPGFLRNKDGHGEDPGGEFRVLQ